MQPLKSLLIVAVLALTGLGQSIEVKPFVADLAKSVKVEQLPESVAVIFTERVGTKSGAYLQVTSSKKWATPVLDGVEITRTKQPGEWILFTQPGTYRILLAEFDPETGPEYTYHTMVIEGKPKPDEPDKPDDPPPPPPVGDYAALKQVAKQTADALDDPATRTALATAYRSVPQSGKSYDELVSTTKMARRMALQSRQGDSRAKDWSGWLTAVDAELVKVVKPGDSAAYLAALKTIVQSLDGQ